MDDSAPDGATNWSQKSMSKEEAIAALRAHAFTVDDEESGDHGRTLIHSRLSGMGANHDLDHAIRMVESAQDLFWADSPLEHDLVVVTAGKAYWYDVPRPERAIDPGHGEGDTSTEEDERFRAKVEHEPNRMTAGTFRALGLLQEVNRRILHPLGLALEVIVDEDGSTRFGEVWDYRDDPEGMIFAMDEAEAAAFGDRAVRVALEWERRRPDRVSACGYMVQPLGESVDEPLT